MRLRLRFGRAPGSAEDASDWSLVLEPVPFSKGLSLALPSPALKWGYGERDRGALCDSSGITISEVITSGGRSGGGKAPKNLRIFKKNSPEKILFSLQDPVLHSA